MAIKSHIQRFDLGEEVVLFEIDLVEFGLGIIRITPATKTNSAAVSFGGQIYSPHPVRAEGFEISTVGSLPRPRVSIANLDNSFTALVEQNDDLHGAKLTRIRTFGRYLDGAPDADGSAHLPKDIYILSQKTEHTQERISWQCAAMMDQEGVELPGRTIVRDYCDHQTRRWNPSSGTFDYTNVTCPYTGTPRDEKGLVCSGPDEVFSKRLKTCCQARFGVTAVLPTRAFPGAARVRVRS